MTTIYSTSILLTLLLPASSFIGRRRLYGRIISVNTLENGSGIAGDIQIRVRHLSPIGQILPKSWFDFLVKFSPQASRLGSNASAKPEENSRQLLKVKIGECILVESSYIQQLEPVAMPTKNCI